MRHLIFAINHVSLAARRDVSIHLLRLLMLAAVLCLAFRPVLAVTTLSSVDLSTTPSGTALYGTQVTLTAAAVGGSNIQYKFLVGTYILRDFSISNNCIWTPGYLKTYDNLTVVAKDLNSTVVSPVTTLIITTNLATSSVNGNITKSPNLAEYSAGAVVTLTAVPDAGFHFLNWTGDITGVTNPVNITMNGYKSVTANFAHGPQPVILNSAGNFLVLAGTTVTNIGPTYIDGNLGLSPGAAVDGFPPGEITGLKLTASDPTIMSAKVDLTNAYVDAAGRSDDVIIVPSGELGGEILVPGLYRSGISSFAISSTDLTLNGQGDANAVWIFQMPSSTLTVGNSRKVVLTGGAQPKNIFWQVGSSATLGTASIVEGNILALASITLNTGATLYGRALARNAAVSLDDSTILKPETLIAVSLTTSPINTSIWGSPVILTATATGGLNVEYKFMTGTIIIRNFASSNSYVWTPGYFKTYDNLTVIARDLSGTVTSPVVSLVVTSPPITAVTVATSPLNTSSLGELVTLTATVTGGGINKKYKFMIGTYILRDFSTSSNCTWTPAVKKTYDNITVVVQDINSTVTSPGVSLTVTDPVITAVSVTTSPLTTSTFGEVVTLTATPTGGSIGVEYKFMIGTYILRDFSTSNTCTWTPAAKKTYNNITVIARNSSGSVTSPAVSLTVVDPIITAVTIASSPVNTAVFGQQVTLTATATGGENNEYKFMIGAIILRDFTSSNSCTWTPALKKTYTDITVTARNTGGSITSTGISLLVTP